MEGGASVYQSLDYDRTTSNKLDLLYLIFDSNSTIFVAKYVIPKKWLKLAPCLKLRPSVPRYNFLAITYVFNFVSALHLVGN